MITAGTLSEIPHALKLAETDDCFYTTVGVHPTRYEPGLVEEYGIYLRCLLHLPVSTMLCICMDRSVLFLPFANADVLSSTSPNTAVQTLTWMLSRKYAYALILARYCHCAMLICNAADCSGRQGLRQGGCYRGAGTRLRSASLLPERRAAEVL